VYDTLKKDGYTVSVVQNPTISLADDVAVTKRTLAAQDGPAILVGHSYGGVVILVQNRRSQPSRKTVAGLVRAALLAGNAPATRPTEASTMKAPTNVAVSRGWTP
jgi:predicted alpha/beta hydrolase family esterase